MNESLHLRFLDHGRRCKMRCECGTPYSPANPNWKIGKDGVAKHDCEAEKADQKKEPDRG